MKKLMSICFVLLFVALTPTDAKDAKTQKVKELRDGWYWQSQATNVQIIYYVDTKAKLCFCAFTGTAGGGLTVIDSNKLKNREEWKDIITW